MMRRCRPLGLVLAVPVLALTLGACGTARATNGVASAGGATASTTAGAGPETGADRSEQLRQFAQCMRDNGVDMPDPDPNAGGFVLRPGPGPGAMDRGSPAFRAAMQACRDKLPNGGVPPSLDPAQQEQLREFAQCMRDNGVDMPDPDPNGGGAALRFGQSGIDPNSPAFRQAMEACQDKRPQLRGGNR